MSRNDHTNSTRRRFLTASAAIGAVAFAGCTGDAGGSQETTTATETEMTTTMAETTTEATTEETTQQAMAHPDVDVLNYALTLEHLENAFYRDGLKEFSDDELMEADVLSKFGEAVRMDVPEYLAVAGKHEKAHVKAITATVEKLGGTPVEEAEYDFGYSTPTEFLAVAKALENTGVAAYAGAAPKVVNEDVLAAAAGIHSVEARHASFLNLVNSESPFPNAVDEAKSMDEVVEIASQFITSDMGGERTTTAETTEAMETTGSEPMPQRKKDDGTSDVEILNYALTLEHLENAFYRDGLKEFSNDEIVEADALAAFGEELRMGVPDHLKAVGAHEAAHVKAITDTVEKLGGKPVQEAEYDFGYETPSEYLGVAKALENTGVAAYKGVAPSVSNDAVFNAAIGIHSVEARHAAFLNELNMTSPFPKAVDEPKSMAEVTEIAGQFIVSN